MHGILDTAFLAILLLTGARYHIVQGILRLHLLTTPLDASSRHKAALVHYLLLLLLGSWSS